MIPRSLPFVLCAIVFAPDLLHAQRLLSISEKEIVTTNDQPSYDKMYEDIEIMRRILDRKLEPSYPQIPLEGANTRTEWMYGFNPITIQRNNSLWIDLDGPALAKPDGGTYKMQTAPLVFDMEGRINTTGSPVLWTLWYRREISHTLEGVYLKGQGVVYTATLSSLQPAAKTETAKKPVSEWESVRRQLRNEKEKPKKPEAIKPPSLSDVLLKVLADNGHNLSQLRENESLTIIITVHEPSPSSTATTGGTGSAKSESNLAASGVSGLRAEVRDNELLGELHLKQGKHEEAIKAFHYVLTRTSDPKREAELHRKLARCYLMQGQDEKARAELDQAIAVMKKDEKAKAKPAPAAKSAPALPVKLIISAPKKLLDQVKEGKISFEEFRRQARVETLRFGDRR